MVAELQVIWENFSKFIGGRGGILHWLIFCAALCYCVFLGKKERRTMVYPSLLVLLVFINPFFYRYIGNRFFAGVYWRLMWMVPVAFVAAYAVTKVVYALSGRLPGTGKKERPEDETGADGNPAVESVQKTENIVSSTSSVDKKETDEQKTAAADSEDTDSTDTPYVTSAEKIRLAAQRSAALQRGTVCYQRMYQDTTQKEKTSFGVGLVRAVILVLACAGLAASGNRIYNEQVFIKAENIYKLPQAAVDVADVLAGAGVNWKVKSIVPNELLCYIRQYRCDIGLFYGRNIGGFISEIGEDETAVYEEMSKAEPDVSLIAELAKKNEVVFICFNRKTQKLPEDMTKTGYRLYRETGDYAIYMSETI